MYDLEIILPVSKRDKYGLRLKDFKKIGLLNIKDKKIILKLLIGTEPPSDFCERWLEDFDVVTVSGPSNFAAAKIYHYYSSLKPNHYKTARWFGRIDDDSITDVSGLIDNLDLEFDHTANHYAVTCLCADQHHEEIELLKDSKYNRWVAPGAKPILHEWEACFLSQATMKSILSNQDAIKFIENRSKISHGVGDFSLAIAARMCKIFPAEASFLTEKHWVHRFSLFGGDINHLHYLSHDCNEKHFNMFKKIMLNEIHDDFEFASKVGDKEYMFFRHIRGESQFISTLKLKLNGVITGIDSYNEAFWRVKGENIVFLTENFETSSIFDVFKSDSHIKGRFLYENNVFHSIIPL